jgi:hypothetical protein
MGSDGDLGVIDQSQHVTESKESEENTRDA